MNLFGGKGFFPWRWTTPTPYQGPPHPPQNHTYGQYFQQKKNNIDG